MVNGSQIVVSDRVMEDANKLLSELPYFVTIDLGSHTLDGVPQNLIPTTLLYIMPIELSMRQPTPLKTAIQHRVSYFNAPCVALPDQQGIMQSGSEFGEEEKRVHVLERLNSKLPRLYSQITVKEEVTLVFSVMHLRMNGFHLSENQWINIFQRFCVYCSSAGISRRPKIFTSPRSIQEHAQRLTSKTLQLQPKMPMNHANNWYSSVLFWQKKDETLKTMRSTYCNKYADLIRESEEIFSAYECMGDVTSGIFMLAFRNALDAVKWALWIQHETMSSKRWSTLSSGIVVPCVCAGIYTGFLFIYSTNVYFSVLTCVFFFFVIIIII